MRPHPSRRMAGRGARLRSRVFFSLLLSSLLILLPSSVGAAVLGAHILRAAAQESEANNRFVLDNLVSEAEGALNDAIQVSYRCSENVTIRRYATVSRRDYIEEYDISLLLSNLMAGYDTLSDCFLYFPQLNYALYSGGGTGARSYFEQNFGGEFEEWTGLLTQPGFNMRFVLFDTGMGWGGGPSWSDIAVVRAVSQNNATGLPVAAVARLNTAHLQKRMASLGRTPNDRMVIYNGGGVIASTADAELTSALIAAVPQGAEAGQRIACRAAGEDFDLFAASSNSYYFNVVYAASPQLRIAASRLVWSYVMLVLLLGVLLSGALSLALAWRNYLPVRRLMALIEGGDALTLYRNEYQIIGDALKGYIGQNRFLTERIDRCVNEFQELYLEKLLRGRVGYTAGIAESCRLYGIDFPGETFLLLRLEMTEDSLLFDDAEMEERERARLTQLVVKNIVTEVCSSICPTYVVQIDAGMTAICNPAGGDASAEVARLLELARGSLVVMDEKFGLRFDLYSTGLYEGVERLKDAYDEVLAAGAQQEPAGPRPEPREASALIERCIAIIRERYADSSLSIAGIAQEVGVHPSYLSRFFKQQTGVGVLDYLHRYRLSMAKALLTAHPATVLGAVAEKTGFYNAPALIRVFKKFEGMTPGQFKNSLK